MAFALLQNISVTYGVQEVLRGVSLPLDNESRIALAGENGSGKTTLLRIAAGLAHPDTGDVQFQKDSIVAYLPQSGLEFTGKTLIEETDLAFSRFHAIEERKAEIEDQLAEKKGSSRDVEKLLHEHDENQQILLNADYYERDRKIVRVLLGLGFNDEDIHRQTEEFSGGWQMRIGLAKVLLENPDIVLLDEPTNYLDIEARTWLEEYLTQFKGGVVVVSHDKFFLDVTVKSVAELFRGGLTLFRGNYSEYERQRDVQRESLLAAYKQQQIEIERIEAFVRRFRAKPTKASQVQSRVRQLEKMERVEIPESMKRIAIRFPPAPHSGKIVLRIDQLSRQYGDLRVLNELDLVLERGDKLVIAGKNGAGKSTLMRILAQADTGYTGTVRLGAGVKIGYFSQDLDSLPKTGNVLEAMESVAETSDVPRLRTLLGAFLFHGDDVYKQISVLSGGERSRLALLLMLLHPTNLLVLDEPTNHLDMASKRVLLDALKDFGGTLVFVSHDRYFIEALADRVIELKEGRWRLFPGNYQYYLWRTSEEADNPIGNAPDVNETPNGSKSSEVRMPTDVDAPELTELASPGNKQTETDTENGDIEDSGREIGSKVASAREENPSGGILLSSKTKYVLPGRAAKTSGHLSRDEEKELRKRLRRLLSSESENLARLEELDDAHERVQSDLSKEENYTNGARVRKLTEELAKIEAERSSRTETWSDIEVELSTVRGRLLSAGREV
jgi:ATP-binding cassette, subfamily F, member 3